MVAFCSFWDLSAASSVSWNWGQHPSGISVEGQSVDHHHPPASTAHNRRNAAPHPTHLSDLPLRLRLLFNTLLHLPLGRINPPRHKSPGIRRRQSLPLRLRPGLQQRPLDGRVHGRRPAGPEDRTGTAPDLRDHGLVDAAAGLLNLLDLWAHGELVGCGVLWFGVVL